jgi:hypothetical protein
VKEATQATGRRLREAIERRLTEIKSWFTTPWDTRRWASVFGVSAVAVAFGWLWREFGRAWWRGLRRGVSGKRGIDPVRREAGRWLARIAEGEAREGDRDPELELVRQELLRLRFGARATWADPEKVFRRARAAIRAARRGGRMAAKR